MGDSRTLRRRSSASLARSRALCHLMTSFSDMVATSSSLSASRGLLHDIGTLSGRTELGISFALQCPGQIPSTQTRQQGTALSLVDNEGFLWKGCCGQSTIL